MLREVPLRPGTTKMVVCKPGMQHVGRVGTYISGSKDEIYLHLEGVQFKLKQEDVDLAAPALVYDSSEKFLVIDETSEWFGYVGELDEEQGGKIVLHLRDGDFDERVEFPWANVYAIGAGAVLSRRAASLLKKQEVGRDVFGDLAGARQALAKMRAERNQLETDKRNLTATLTEAWAARDARSGGCEPLRDEELARSPEQAGEQDRRFGGTGRIRGRLARDGRGEGGSSVMSRRRRSQTLAQIVLTTVPLALGSSIVLCEVFPWLARHWPAQLAAVLATVAILDDPWMRLLEKIGIGRRRNGRIG